MGHEQPGPATRENQIVPDESLEKALHFLAQSAKQIGAAKARFVMAGYYVKHVEALEFLSADGAMELRKAKARTSGAYTEATTEAAIAAGEFEKLQALREAATLRIEAWRSEQANFRSMRL